MFWYQVGVLVPTKRILRFHLRNDIFKLEVSILGSCSREIKNAHPGDVHACSSHHLAPEQKTKA